MFASIIESSLKFICRIYAVDVKSRRYFSGGLWVRKKKIKGSDQKTLRN